MPIGIPTTNQINILCAAIQHMDRKTQDSSNAKAGQPKLKKKLPAQVARYRARQKDYFNTFRLPDSLELRTSPNNTSFQVVSQPEKSICLDRTSDVSQSYQLQETETVASTQVPVASKSDICGYVARTSAVSEVS